MSWQELLAKPKVIAYPWVGQGWISTWDRTYALSRPFPIEHGWYNLQLGALEASVNEISDPDITVLASEVTGYLVGDRLIPDMLHVPSDPASLAQAEKVWLVEDTPERFSRIEAGRAYENGPLIFKSLIYPTGAETEVVKAFEDQKPDLNGVSGVIPGLDAAFRLETWRRTELEKQRQEFLAKQAAEALIQQQKERYANGVRAISGRQYIHADFETAARTALAVGGAEYLDHRQIPDSSMVVRFRLQHRRFECVCHEETLRIIDSGICLTDESTGIKCDDLYTLESLPGVISEAIREGVLVVWRRVDA